MARHRRFNRFRRSYGSFRTRTRTVYMRSRAGFSKNKKLVKWLTIALVLVGALALFAPKYINMFKSKIGLGGSVQ